jgi:2-polyprenyl-6-methoxyphenol hydroxylase-like FAD-dependent oxidoreductase
MLVAMIVGAEADMHPNLSPYVEAMDDGVEVLVVGAGPTGLSMAAQLAAYGVRPRIIDRNLDRVHESRALAIQPRTLEVLAGLGVTEELLAHGNRTVRLRLHAGNRVREIPMFDLGLEDTAYPYLLFLSQAETERVLDAHLRAADVVVERGAELVDLHAHDDGVRCRLRHPDGRAETVDAAYVAGCDGAHSTVRRMAGIAFQGSSYPQTFVLADVDADGLQPGSAHAFLAGPGILFFFPLVHPATWRLIVMRPPGDPTPADAPVGLEEVQSLTDAYTDGAVRLRDPVWMTNFRLHLRAAARYRAGRVFLAGDAAHIHSPAGAQGMNTGIQDAVNLGWKLAQVARGGAVELLDTYAAERAPVGRLVLRFTDRAFTVATSRNSVVRFARSRVAPLVLPLAMRVTRARARAFRTIAQLGLNYRDSPLSADGDRFRRGPRPGDRLPDAPVEVDGRAGTLHQAMAAPGWDLLLCGPSVAWRSAEELLAHRRPVVTVHRLGTGPEPGIVHDVAGQALRRLGTGPSDVAHYLVRPDGHVAFRGSGADLTGCLRHLERWTGTARRDGS